MLKIKDLSVFYGEKQVLRELNFHLEKPGVFGIAGLNGAGKTTLLKTICGQLNARSGSITYKNRSLLKKEVAFLETENYFYPNITGGEYLRLFAAQNPGFDLNGWNEIFQLPLDQLISGYSTGMKKKTAFLGNLSLDRPVMILDEPFNGLDLDANQILKRIISQLRKQGKIIIITSHILEALKTLCDHISFLEEGRIANQFTEENFDKLEHLLHQHREQGIEALVGKIQEHD